MKIITFNLQKGGSGGHHWSHVIDAFDPDIFLVQESFPPEHCGLLNLRGQAFWRPANSERYGVNEWGTAVFLKCGRVTELPIERFQGWLVGVEIEGMILPGLAERRLRAFSLHAPPREITGNSYEETVSNMLNVIKDNRGDADLIIGGDFNLYSLGDRHQSEQKHGNPWITKPKEREILTRLREEFGLINCWQKANPGVPLAQTLRANNSPCAFHCDGIFVPNAWGEALRSCDVVDSEMWARQGKDLPPKSDHNPVVATFVLEQHRSRKTLS